MPIYSLFHRWTRDRVAILDAPTYAGALELAVREGMDLVGVDLTRASLRRAFLSKADLRGAALHDADLCSCYLHGADLRGADLRGTRLAHAFLSGADLRRADLRGAVLTRADLRGASLLGVDLRGTILTGARLDGALCDWRWSAIPAELLRKRSSAPCNFTRLMIELLFHDDSDPWSWLEILSRHQGAAAWALSALTNWIRPGDNSGEFLQRLSTGSDKDREAASVRSSPRCVIGCLAGPDRAGNAASDRSRDVAAPTRTSLGVLWIRRSVPGCATARLCRTTRSHD